MDIVVAAPLPWGHLPQRFQHVAAALAGLGHRVLYVEPMTSVLGPLRSPRLLSAWPRWWAGRTALAERLLRYGPPPVFPPFHDRSRWASRASQRLLAWLIRRQVQALGWSPPVVLACAPWPDLVGRCGERLVIYDCCDDHGAFGWSERDLTNELEREMATRADVVTVTSRQLAAKLAAWRPVLVQNGVQPERWRDDLPEPADLARLPRPRACYWGVLNPRIDVELLRGAARASPHVSFVLIGPPLHADVAGALAGEPNVHCLGPRPYEALPAYGAHADVLLLPFVLDDVTRATNPLKLYEYLACGRPVVSTPLPEVLPFADVVGVAEGPAAFTRALEEALRSGPGDRAARRAVAAANSWTARAQALVAAAEAALGPAAAPAPPADGGPGPVATVVVPCFNEERCIGRCLDALAAQTIGPIEVVVVDDGSTDGTLRAVAARARRGLPLTVLRQDHQGPARARNLAATRARGEVLVFLDADMFPDPAFVERLLAPIMAGAAKGTFTRQEVVANAGAYWADVWSVASGLPPGRRYAPEHPATSRCFRGLLRAEFERVGGYGDVGVGGVGEDFTLSQRLGYEAQDAPGAVVQHENPGTFGDVWASAAWYGKAVVARRGYAAGVRALVRRLPPVSLVARAVGAPLRYWPGLVLHDLAFALGTLRGMWSGRLAK